MGEKVNGRGEGAQEGIVCGVNVLRDSDQSGNRFSDCATSLVSVSCDQNGREKKRFERRDSPFRVTQTRAHVHAMMERNR